MLPLKTCLTVHIAFMELELASTFQAISVLVIVTSTLAVEAARHDPLWVGPIERLVKVDTVDVLRAAHDVGVVRLGGSCATALLDKVLREEFIVVLTHDEAHSLPEVVIDLPMLLHLVLFKHHRIVHLPSVVQGPELFHFWDIKSFDDDFVSALRFPFDWLDRLLARQRLHVVWQLLLLWCRLSRQSFNLMITLSCPHAVPAEVRLLWTVLDAMLLLMSHNGLLLVGTG